MNNKLNIILNLNLRLNMYEYGIPIDGIITDISSMEYYDKNYKSLSPKEFDDLKGGICWDYVRYQDYYLSKYDITHSNYFIIDPNTFATHTVTIIKIKEKYYYIESSFKKFCGVYESNNIKSIFSFIIHNMKIDNYCIFNIKEFPKNHTKSNDYMQYMTNMQNLIIKGKTKKLKFVNLKNLQKPFKLPKNHITIEEYVNDINDYTVESADDIKYMSLENESCEEYLKQNKDYKKYYAKIRNEYNGEIAINPSSNELVGYIFIKTNKKEKGFISPLWVSKKYRNRGVGKKLLKDAIDKYNAIDLVVKKDNKIALNLYKKYGFVIIGDGNNDKEYWMKLKRYVN